MGSLQPTRVDFIGGDKILQGTDWERSVPFIVDMSIYDPATNPGAALTGAIVSADFGTDYLNTTAGTMLLSFIDSTHLRVRVTKAGGEAIAPFKNANWQAFGKSAATGLWDRIASGVCEMDTEAK